MGQQESRFGIVFFAARIFHVGYTEGFHPRPTFFLLFSEICHIIQLTPQKLSAEPRNSASTEALAFLLDSTLVYVYFSRGLCLDTRLFIIILYGIWDTQGGLRGVVYCPIVVQ